MKFHLSIGAVLLVGFSLGILFVSQSNAYVTSYPEEPDIDGICKFPVQDKICYMIPLVIIDRY